MKFPTLFSTRLAACFPLILTCLLGPTTGRGQDTNLAPALEFYARFQDAECRKALESVVAARPDHAPAHFWLGRLALEHFNPAQGVTHLEKAAALAPTNSLYAEWLGRAYGTMAVEASLFRRPGYAKKTLAQFESAVALDPKNIPARYMLIAYYLGAPGFMGGSDAKAARQAEAIRQVDPVEGANAAAQIAFTERDIPSGEKELKTAVTNHPANAAAHLNLALLQLMQQRFQEAWKSLRRSRELEPTNSLTLYHTGRAGMLSGQNLDEAESALREFLRQRPGYGFPSPGQARFVLGQVFERAKRPEDARREFEEAHRMEPKNQEFANKLRTLR